MDFITPIKYLHMADNKKGFVLYSDLIHTVSKMPKGKQAELFMTILKYVNDENPKVEDLIVSLVWQPIKLQLKRDLFKYEEFRRKQSENGKKGGRPPIETETQNNPNNPSLYLETQKSLTVKDTVTVTDTVKDIERVKEVTLPKNEIENIIIETEIQEKEKSCEKKENPLIHSNLFRQPKIPSFQEVHEFFVNSGGNKEMADKFFSTHAGVGWFNRGSPITNFRNFVPSYISSWKLNEKKSNGNSNTVSENTRKFGRKSAGFGVINDALAEFERRVSNPN